MRTKPLPSGESFIVNTAGDHKDTWSIVFEDIVKARACMAELETYAKGMVGRLEISQYMDGKLIGACVFEEDINGVL